MINSNKEIWAQQSLRWKNVGLPTRPTPEDIEMMHELVIKHNRKLEQIAVLGVTPEVVQIPWPEITKLRAFDLSKEMIASLWEPNKNVLSEVIHADWQALPLLDDSIDLFVGDGCLTALPGIEIGAKVFREVFRCLNPEGRLIMRCFIRPKSNETLEQIIADVNSQQIHFFGSLKWRIAMAICDADTATVVPSQIIKVFNECFPDRESLSSQTGWDIGTINTIDSYRDMLNAFTFPSMSQIEYMSNAVFHFEEIKYGSYELSSRCPVISFQK